MKKMVLLAAVLATSMGATGRQPRDGTGVRFEAVDVYVDSGQVPLAAYQLEVTAGLGTDSAGRVVKLVGVEGGEEGGAFEEPPVYDAEALRGERIILAAYSLADDARLPRGKTRVARIQVQVPELANPVYRCFLSVAGNSMAEEIPAQAEAARLSSGPIPAAPAPPPSAAPPAPSKR